MQYSPEITELFNNTNLAGAPDSDSSIILQEKFGQQNRSCVHLFLAYVNGKWQASYLVSGGVVLIATAEYWARSFNHQRICDNTETIMKQLKIPAKWQSDVAIVTQAAKKIQQQWMEQGNGRTTAQRR